MRSDEVRSGQVRSGQVRSGQVRSGQVRSGQVLAETSNFRSVKETWPPGQLRLGQDRPYQMRYVQLGKTSFTYTWLVQISSVQFNTNGASSSWLVVLGLGQIIG